MPKKEITKTQMFKVYTVLVNHKKHGIPLTEITKITGYPAASIRRILSDMYQLDKLEKIYTYRLK